MSVNKNKISAQAQKLTAKGQFEKAIQEYKKLLKAEPNDIRTWLKMGDLYTRMGARKEATETYLKVAEHYRKSDFHLKAVAVYKQVLKLDPTLIDVYELLGDAYMSLGLNSDALIQFEQLADMYQRAGRFDRMLQVLERMAEMDPQNISTRLRIAEQYSKDKQVEAACRHFEVACGQLREQGRTDDFLKVAERLLYHDQSRVDLAREAAISYLEKGQTKRALAKLQMCFSKDPRDVATLELLAQAFKDLGQPDKAVSVYLEISNILRDKGQKSQQRRILGLVLELDPDNETARKVVGTGVRETARREESGELPSLASMATATTKGAPRESVSAPEELSDEAIASRAEKLLGEAEVLLKYGLAERAKDHISKIFEFDYYNLDARERFKDLLLEEGNQEAALEQLFVLAEGFVQEQPEGSVYFLHQILAIDPYNRRARDMIVSIGGVMPEGLPDLDAGGFSADALLDPGMGDDGGIEEQQLLYREETPAPAPPSALEDDLDVLAEEPSIEDVPYVAGDNELTDLDLEGSAGWEDDEVLDLDAESAVGTDAGIDSKRYALVDTDPARPTPPAPESLLPVRAAPPSVPARRTPPTPHAQGVVAVRPKPTAVQSAPEPRPSTAREDRGDLPDLSSELEEIEFFMSQGLLDEARGIVETLLRDHPDDPRVLPLREQVGLFRVSSSPAEAALDLDALAEDLGVETITHDEIVNEIDEVFSQFKAGVEKQVSQTDFATHYDLGVAYKEMGLFEDAISEFEISIRDPGRAVSSQMMIGMCHAGAGRLQDAIVVFEEGLELDEITQEQRLALMYELGKAFELHGRMEDALELYNEILTQDPGFADVVDRIEIIEKGGRTDEGGHSVFS